MCRNIRKLRNPAGPPSEAELHEAALQFVRKISGYRVPSKANQATFDEAVRQIAAVSQRMFEDLVAADGKPLWGLD